MDTAVQEFVDLQDKHIHIDVVVLSKKKSTGPNLQGKIVTCIIEDCICNDCNTSFSRRSPLNDRLMAEGGVQ
jgi:hypothetical protein